MPPPRPPLCSLLRLLRRRPSRLLLKLVVVLVVVWICLLLWRWLWLLRVLWRRKGRAKKRHKRPSPAVVAVVTSKGAERIRGIERETRTGVVGIETETGISIRMAGTKIGTAMMVTRARGLEIGKGIGIGIGTEGVIGTGTVTDIGIGAGTGMVAGMEAGTGKIAMVTGAEETATGREAEIGIGLVGMEIGVEMETGTEKESGIGTETGTGAESRMGTGITGVGAAIALRIMRLGPLLSPERTTATPSSTAVPPPWANRDRRPVLPPTVLGGTAESTVRCAPPPKRDRRLLESSVGCGSAAKVA
mmetsp:Transcript_2635/g.5657  ORF Transcript_2635/g.5657 Transcript_2635/m.5657 type:complete len:304 (+) Transcript_2635:566-1477(+)